MSETKKKEVVSFIDFEALDLKLRNRMDSADFAGVSLLIRKAARNLDLHFLPHIDRLSRWMFAGSIGSIYGVFLSWSTLKADFSPASIKFLFIFQFLSALFGVACALNHVVTKFLLTVAEEHKEELKKAFEISGYVDERRISQEVWDALVSLVRSNKIFLLQVLFFWSSIIWISLELFSK